MAIERTLSIIKPDATARNLTGAMEKALAEELAEAGYRVLNTVKWQHAYDPIVWELVRKAFGTHFPNLAKMKLRSSRTQKFPRRNKARK